MKKVLLCLVFLVCLLKAVTIDELVKHTNENNYDLKSIDKYWNLRGLTGDILFLYFMAGNSIMKDVATLGSLSAFT